MKKAILFILIGAALGGGGVWFWQHGDGDEKRADEKAADNNSPSVSRDEDGNSVVTLSNEVQRAAGIMVANPEAARFAPELKGYGRVLDPTPLGALMTEMASARAAAAASSNELARLKILAGQGNTSARALQTAEAAALRDDIAVQSAGERLVLSDGMAVAKQNDLPGFIRALMSGEKVLVRIDLPAGENLQKPPMSARLITLSGVPIDGEFLGPASAVDPQTQGRGFIFLADSGAAQLTPGEAVTGFLKLPGEPWSGVIVSRAAIVRTEGRGWIYVQGKSGETFTRKEIALEHGTDAGWFVTNGVTAADRVVVTGAQMLLSVELKPASAD